MILVDANLLIYAHVSSFPLHDAARKWLNEKRNGVAPVGLPWPSILGFLRIVTNPRIFERPEPPDDAWRQAAAWLDFETVWTPQPTNRHREVFAGIVRRCAVKANLIPDAHLAALAIEHGLILCSTDNDFAGFPGLKWKNPILNAPSDPP